jgi:predicted RNA-binding Zn-ribbon protein involved in translation (DUF1610 family)
MNTFGAAMLFYQQSNLEYHLGSAHNDYLQILSDGGLLVGLPVAVASVALAVAIRRRLHAASADAQTYWIRAGAAAALAAIAVQEVFEFTLQIGANAFLFCTMAAVALAPVRIAPTAHWLETTTAAAFNCPECGSMRLFRSRSRSRREVWRKQMTKKRLYRCHDCGWRDWCDDFGESHAPVVLPAERAGRDLTDA